MARSRAVDAREPGQVREEAALSEAAHAPRVSLAGAEPGGTLEASVSTRGARSALFQMRVALASEELPGLDPDDAPLLVALGDEAEPAVWSDPDVDWSAYDAVLIPSRVAPSACAARRRASRSSPAGWRSRSCPTS